MTTTNANRTKPPNTRRRIRLSEWARDEGIAWITAYRMLQRGTLPVPFERSPTGRWYVLVPKKQVGQLALYTRATPGPSQAVSIDTQIAALTSWAVSRHQQVYIVVREIGKPLGQQMPKLARLLADPEISSIVVKNPTVVGEAHYNLLVAALAPQGRTIVVIDEKKYRGRLEIGCGI